ncbi:MAG: SGNH/GDSL hydrolase family protein, partial [Phycisphaeraceae bacterium]
MRLPTRIFIALALVLLAASPLFAQAKKQGPFDPIEDNPKLPRVLLIGDSISIGYHLDVRAMLEGKANVHRPPTNCGPTTNGLKSLDAWLKTGGAEKKWDVIHFNWGLHDLKYQNEKGTLVDVKAGKQQVPPEDYEKNLRELVAKLKKTGAKLIWCATT